MASEQSVSNAEILAEDNKDRKLSIKICRDSFWKGQYYCVPLCHNTSGQSEERRRLGSGRVSFHSFPGMSTYKKGLENGL